MRARFIIHQMHLRALKAIMVLSACFVASENFAQTGSNLSIASRLREIREVPHYQDTTMVCGDAAFWSVVRLGKEAIPELIELVKDSSGTAVPLPCTTETLALGDVAFQVLDEIISVPYALVFHNQWCLFGGGCDFRHPDGFVSFLRRHRIRCSGQLVEWFERYSSTLSSKKLTKSSYWDCRRAHGLNYQLEMKYED